jgi:hypothetical protein
MAKAYITVPEGNRCPVLKVGVQCFRVLQSEARRIWAQFDDGDYDVEDDPPPYVELKAAKRRLTEGGHYIRMGDWDDEEAGNHKLRVQGSYWWVPYLFDPVRLRICPLVTTPKCYSEWRYCIHRYVEIQLSSISTLT